MNRLVFLVFFAIFVVLAPMASGATEPDQSVVIVGEPLPAPGTPIRTHYVEEVIVWGKRPPDRSDEHGGGILPPTKHNQILVASVVGASAMMDAGSTLADIASGAGHEGNGVVAPFAKSKVGLYAYEAGTTVVVAGVGYLLAKNPKTEKWWWVPAATTTALHLYATNRANNIQDAYRRDKQQKRR